MNKAFTIIEILIVVAILGILTAIVVPVLQSHVAQTKETTAKENLYLLRNTIERYAAQHNGIPPGYADNGSSQDIHYNIFWAQLIRDGKYLPSMPENIFNSRRYTKMIPDNIAMPAEATGEFGWIYKPATKDFRLDWPGEDSTGMRFYDY